MKDVEIFGKILTVMAAVIHDNYWALFALLNCCLFQSKILLCRTMNISSRFVVLIQQIYCGWNPFACVKRKKKEKGRGGYRNSVWCAITILPKRLIIFNEWPLDRSAHDKSGEFANIQSTSNGIDNNAIIYMMDLSFVVLHQAAAL